MITLFFTLAYMIMQRNKKENFSQDPIIPRTIWTYWHNYDLDPVVVQCVKTWKNCCPDFEIIILNHNNYQKYIDNDKIRHDRFDNVTRFADFLRFELLSRHGGIWMDATIVCNQSLEWVIQENKDFVGYYMPNFTMDERYPVIENWFMACSKNCKLMREWNKEVQRILEFENTDVYVDNLKSQKVDLQNIPYPGYLMCHAAAQKVLQNSELGIDPSSYKVISATSDIGAFYYLDQENWDSSKALNNFSKKQYRTPIMKLRGLERIEIEKMKSFDVKG